jgi:GNAT superfamily N-acetyltransferase
MFKIERFDLRDVSDYRLKTLLPLSFKTGAFRSFLKSPRMLRKAAWYSVYLYVAYKGTSRTPRGLAILQIYSENVQCGVFVSRNFRRRGLGTLLVKRAAEDIPKGAQCHVAPFDVKGRTLFRSAKAKCDITYTQPIGI